MFKVVRAAESTQRQIAPAYKANNFITKDVCPNVSLAVNEATSHQETEYTQYDRIYYVLEGQIEFNFDGQLAVVQAGDACFVTSGTEYKFGGTFKSVVVNQPAFGSKA